ncbi:MAG TPA: AAA family ATPase [Microvirga sp.]|jgi:ATP-dependent Zn protease|nr:AAA family ATPase [Microvirga sp.]
MLRFLTFLSRRPAAAESVPGSDGLPVSSTSVAPSQPADPVAPALEIASPNLPHMSDDGLDSSEPSTAPVELDFEEIFGPLVAPTVAKPSPASQDDRQGGRLSQPRPKPPSPLQLVAGLALDAAWTGALARDLDRGRPLVLVVEVPAASWVGPIKACLLSRLPVQVEVLSLTSRPKATSTLTPELDAPRALAGGETFIAITPDAGWLSPVTLAAADHALTLRPLTPAQVVQAIKLWTGRALKQPLEAEDLASLDLPDIAAALRPGSTPAACAQRLRRASRTRIGPPETSGEVISLEQMTGMGEAQAWATELVAAIHKVKAGRLPASQLAGGVLYGKPGTGKSTLARSIAAEAGVPYHETSVGAWFSQSSGNLDGVIKEIDRFCDALTLAARSSGDTAIGFLDEIDALPNRSRLSDRGADWWLPVITHCLLRVEALRRAGVVLIAATNDITRVDAALLRPGRLDRAVEVPPPDERGRMSVLRHHLGRDLKKADLTPAVRLSRGATGAVLAGAVRAARRRADAAGRTMTLADLLIEIAPADERSPEELRVAALHEAGHAVLALRLGLSLVSVTIQAGEGSGGATTIRRTELTPDRDALERQVVNLLAGRAADRVLGGGAHAGAACDLREAKRLVAALHASLGLGERLLAPVDPDRADEWLRLDRELAAAVEQDLRRLQGTAEMMVAANRAAILAVADALLAQRVLTGEEVAAIARDHQPRVRVRAATEASIPDRQARVPPRAERPLRRARHAAEMEVPGLPSLRRHTGGASDEVAAHAQHGQSHTRHAGVQQQPEQ